MRGNGCVEHRLDGGNGERVFVQAICERGREAKKEMSEGRMRE